MGEITIIITIIAAESPRLQSWEYVSEQPLGVIGNNVIVLSPEVALIVAIIISLSCVYAWYRLLVFVLANVLPC